MYKCICLFSQPIPSYLHAYLPNNQNACSNNQYHKTLIHTIANKCKRMVEIGSICRSQNNQCSHDNLNKEIIFGIGTKHC